MQGKFKLSVEDEGKDVFAHLGIELTFNGSKVTMRQDGLIKKILQKVPLEPQKKGKQETPASERPVGADLDGEPFQAEWEHSSVVGMLMFLVNTCPDIQFATHLAARHSHSPKMSHKWAVKQIV